MTCGSVCCSVEQQTVKYRIEYRKRVSLFAACRQVGVNLLRPRCCRILTAYSLEHNILERLPYGLGDLRWVRGFGPGAGEDLVGKDIVRELLVEVRVVLDHRLAWRELGVVLDTPISGALVAYIAK